MQNISDIVKKLNEAKEAYYNDQNPILSDSEFDQLEASLKEIDPNNEYFKTVGISSSGKINHIWPMLSMQKAKSVSEVEKWIEKLSLPDKTEFCIQPKIDGLSATCKYYNGKLEYISTRGDGVTGQDITHIYHYMDTIPSYISFTSNSIEIRGELFLPKNTDFDTKNKPLRNNCVGLINRKDNYTDLKHIEFAAFQIIGDYDFKLESDISKILSNEKLNTVPMTTITSIDELKLYYDKYLEELRQQWLFETDGLVITLNERNLFDDIDSRWIVNHHHHYVIALKPPAEAKETNLINIEWQVSRQGNVIPVAIFKPIIIGGAKIERASLNNFKNVIDLNLHLNDTLLIERANDVIPYIKKNVSKDNKRTTNPITLKSCPSCKTTLIEKGVHLKCTNPNCPEMNIQKILYWIKSSEIEQIGEETVRKLYYQKVLNSIADLYTLEPSTLLKIEGFAEKKVRSILSEVEKSKEMSSINFISKLGIPLVQKKAVQKLNIKSITDFEEFNDPTYTIGRNIIEWKSETENMAFFSELLNVINIKDEFVKPKSKKACMTGKGPLSRKELIMRLDKMGYEFVNSITQDTDLLITDDSSKNSTKFKKAKQMNIEIVTYDDFFNILE
jgi:DNA ligase (NAD+)